MFILKLKRSWLLIVGLLIAATAAGFGMGLYTSSPATLPPARWTAPVLPTTLPTVTPAIVAATANPTPAPNAAVASVATSPRSAGTPARATSKTTAAVSTTPLPTITPVPALNTDPVLDGLVAPAPVAEGQRWIDFNLNDSTTRLMEGRRILRELPSAFGYGIPGSDTDFYSTAPGSYRVYSKSLPLYYDYKYSKQFFMGWVGFDPQRANGFHSFLMDSSGKVTDNRLGGVSHGCIHTEDWKAVFDFAQLDMPVIVHGVSPGLAAPGAGS